MHELGLQAVTALRETCLFGGCYILISQFTDGFINNKRLAIALAAFFVLKVVS